MRVFVDLEETLIQSWFDPIPLKEKISVIKSFCTLNNIDKVTIFSLAIANKQDENIFFERILPLFDSMLDLEVDVLNMGEIRDIIECGSNIRFKLSEWSDVFPFNGKSQPFIEMIRATDISDKQNETFVLFDDVVDMMSIHLKELNTKIELVKI